MINQVNLIINKLRSFFGHPIVMYYARHPLILFKNRVIVTELWLKRIFKRDINFDDTIHSEIPIDIIITAADKDYDVLIYAIDSIRKNVKHPIGNIMIISPKSELIIKLCEKEQCNFIDEDTVLPITKKDINYTVAGENRSGWLFQQLLKWSGDKYAKNDYFLIADADTIFCRSQVFAYKEKIILSVNDRLCHIPYFEAYKKLLGIEIKPLLNFTSHHLLFNRTVIFELKQKIEEHCKAEWYKAIINSININEGSCISDYETYGQFVLSNYPNEYILEHWFNLSLSRSMLWRIQKILKENYKKYKTISFHSYK